MSVEVAWFSALCDDDYEFLGVPDPALRSSWEHCGDIVRAASNHGFDNILLPSGYELGIDANAFAAGIGPELRRSGSAMQLLLAIRCAELWPPQLARQLATIDQMLGGRLTINIISSDLPGAPLPSGPRYRRSTEVMHILRSLLNGEAVDFDGEHYQLQLGPPSARTVSGQCPAFYFGGLSDDARQCAAEAADVYLMWPDTLANVRALIDDMSTRAATFGRSMKYGFRVHVVVRETEEQARAAADLLLSKLDAAVGDAIRAKSLDSQSAGVRRQAELREAASSNEGFVEANLWTGIGRARSGCGAAIVGDPDQVLAKLRAYQAAGIDAFILSGYPHLGEMDLFARYVLPHLDHAPLTDYSTAALKG
jgi:alkanesulfonate monooxygenase